MLSFVGTDLALGQSPAEGVLQKCQ